MMVIGITGSPGVGKTSISNELGMRLGCSVISIDEIINKLKRVILKNKIKDKELNNSVNEKRAVLPKESFVFKNKKIFYPLLGSIIRFYIKNEIKKAELLGSNYIIIEGVQMGYFNLNKNGNCYLNLDELDVIFYLDCFKEERKLRLSKREGLDNIDNFFKVSIPNYGYQATIDVSRLKPNDVATKIVELIPFYEENRVPVRIIRKKQVSKYFK